MNKIIDYIKYFDYRKLIFPTVIIILYIIGFLYFEEKTNNIKIPTQETIIIEKEEPIIEEEIIKYIYVDIKGAIKKPGVYKLEENSRIIDAINISGGLNKNANTSYTNLSKKLTDAEVIKIYTNDEIKKLEKENPQELPKIEEEVKNEIIENPKININTADLKTLQTLSGIGESKANSIIEYRTTNGNFKSIEDIKNVSGISEALYEKIKDFITI